MEIDPTVAAATQAQAMALPWPEAPEGPSGADWYLVRTDPLNRDELRAPALHMSLRLAHPPQRQTYTWIMDIQKASGKSYARPRPYQIGLLECRGTRECPSTQTKSYRRHSEVHIGDYNPASLATQQADVGVRPTGPPLSNQADVGRAEVLPFFN